MVVADPVGGTRAASAATLQSRSEPQQRASAERLPVTKSRVAEQKRDTGCNVMAELLANSSQSLTAAYNSCQPLLSLPPLIGCRVFRAQ